MQINLTHLYRDDFKELIRHSELEAQRMRERIARDERDLEETVQPEPMPYVAPPKVKLSPVEIIKR